MLTKNIGQRIFIHGTATTCIAYYYTFIYTITWVMH